MAHVEDLHGVLRSQESTANHPGNRNANRRKTASPYPSSYPSSCESKACQTPRNHLKSKCWEFFTGDCFMFSAWKAELDGGPRLGRYDWVWPLPSCSRVCEAASSGSRTTNGCRAWSENPITHLRRCMASWADASFSSRVVGNEFAISHKLVFLGAIWCYDLQNKTRGGEVVRCGNVRFQERAHVA